MRRAARVLAPLLAVGLLTGCVPSGPPTAAQINAEFGQTIEPVWQTKVAGIFGEPAVGDGVVAVYAVDETKAMRIEVHALDDGRLLWSHAASPAGSPTTPLFGGQNSAIRLYPAPTVQPMLLTRVADTGTDAAPAATQQLVVFFERVGERRLDARELLHVVDAVSGEELEVALDVAEDDYFASVDAREDGALTFQLAGPGRSCGDGPRLCFPDSEGRTAVLDLGRLEVTLTGQELSDPWDMHRTWGPDLVQVHDDELDAHLARVVDGETLWQRRVDDAFADRLPPEEVDFVQAGDVILAQGYLPIRENHGGDEVVLEFDYAASRGITALDRSTGETRWTLDGGDSLCFSVTGLPRDPDATIVPVCLAEAGSYRFGYESNTTLEWEDPEVSIVGVDVSDGSIAWEVPHAGDLALTLIARYADMLYDGRGAYVPVALDDDAALLLDLRDGSTLESPEGASFVCRAERPDVELEFRTVTGDELLGTGHPGGWYQLACDATGPRADWSRGAVRVAGYPSGDTRVLVTEKGLAAFRL